MFSVYVLQNPTGKLYKGFTGDLEGRIAQHNSADGLKSWTKGKGPWDLVYQENFRTSDEARAREKFLKSGKGREYLKLRLGAYPPKADG